MIDSVLLPVIVAFVLIAPGWLGIAPLLRELERQGRSRRAETLTIPVAVFVWLGAVSATGWNKGGMNMLELVVLGLAISILAAIRYVLLRRGPTRFTGPWFVAAVCFVALALALGTPPMGT
jgi:sorbitol-specific phosphotransferase system component IIC